MPPTQTAPISEERIRLIVDAFYREIRVDADLRPIFERVIAGGWETHLAKICDFWSVMPATGYDKGSLLAVGKYMGGLEIVLLHRCLASETAGLCWLRAGRLVESLKLTLFYRLGPAWLRHAA